MRIEGGSGGRILLSYDVADAPRSRRVQACRIVFGRVRTRRDGQKSTELGFIHRPGVVWIGQSVLIMPSKDAAELAERLRRIGARVAMGPVSVDRHVLERFHRG